MPLVVTDHLQITELDLLSDEHAGDRFFAQSCFPRIPVSMWRYGRTRRICGLPTAAAPSVFAVSPRAHLWINIDTITVSGGAGRVMKARDVLREIWGRYRDGLHTLDTVGYAPVLNAHVRAAMRRATLTIQRVYDINPIFDKWLTIALGVDGWADASK